MVTHAYTTLMKPSAMRTYTAAAAAAAAAAQGRGDEVAEARAEEDRIAHDDPLFRKPVGAVEGTGWSLVISAGLAVACLGVYSIVKELVATPREQRVYEYVTFAVLSDQ